MLPVKRKCTLLVAVRATELADRCGLLETITPGWARAALRVEQARAAHGVKTTNAAGPSSD